MVKQSLRSGGNSSYAVLAPDSFMVCFCPPVPSTGSFLSRIAALSQSYFNSPSLYNLYVRTCMYVQSPISPVVLWTPWDCMSLLTQKSISWKSLLTLLGSSRDPIFFNWNPHSNSVFPANSPIILDNEPSCLTSMLDYKPLQGTIQFWFTHGFLPKHLAQKKLLINIYWRKEGLTEGKQGRKCQKLLDLSLSCLTRLYWNAPNWCLCRCQIANHFRKITLMWFGGYSLGPRFDSICILYLSLIWHVMYRTNTQFSIGLRKTGLDIESTMWLRWKKMMLLG